MSERKTYAVTVLIDASKSLDVEADSPDEAAFKATEQVGIPSLCHQCSGEIETGDPTGAHVYDGDTLVLDTSYGAEQVARMQAQRDTLLAVLQNFEITGPDDDGLVWLILNGNGTSGKGMFNLGEPANTDAQVALALEQDRTAAIAKATGQEGKAA